VAVAAAPEVAAAVVAAAGGGEPGAHRMRISEVTMNVTQESRGASARTWTAAVFVLLAALALATSAVAASAAQRTFASPEDAADALVRALKAHDRAATLAVLGNPGDWLSSGDATADRSNAQRFIEQYDVKHAIAREGETATLTLGDDDFPFAFPIVQHDGKWHFDTDAGKTELLARRVGTNELSAMQVLQAIVDAEQEYASEDRDGDGVLAYAQRFASSPGKRDGLYWPTKAGEAPSPLGVLVAQAAGEGYKKGDKAPTPYHGYYYRMLRGQGKNAESGAFDYVLRGRGIAGYAVIAYPAKYGNSGIMTFMVNQDGKIYEADFGPDTKAKADKVQRFDPGPGWSAAVVRP
jgi:hypothetical protein